MVVGWELWWAWGCSVRPPICNTGDRQHAASVAPVSTSAASKKKATSKAAKKTKQASTSKSESASSPPLKTASKSNGLNPDDGLPITMLNDRILVNIDIGEGERRTNGGILIPATAQVGKRLTWAAVIAVGPNVHSVEVGDQVLFNPNDRYEVEVGGTDYLILRQRDIHAVAAERLEEGSTGLYL